MEKQQLMYEGKAKRLYKTEDHNILWVEYKDSATAFNGEKKATIQGKARYNNEISSIIFTILKEKGIPNHFVQQLSPTEQLVQRTTIIPLEVVVRNVTAGSLAKRIGKEEGVTLPKTIVEYYYKDDDLGDPLINEDHIEVLNIATNTQLVEMKNIALQVNELLVDYFASCNVRLVDFKLEFGVNKDGDVLLADEISPDTCRLWDKNTNEKLDKDVYRRDLGSLVEAYDQILQRLKGEQHV
ncbi:phosphoribosylaminoimidazolesuccinocarboxamide synthase [Salirhabdus salicampi]|uniref:phosphoribosylaminoimidazolesuccinocarboxamide synthase n=1 Tax=Salirhabdus salicampi TaxID=476102 RepID=UPI0020C1E4F8|nr:phosphoribosylaminoimidazolesuccinocarboxamide synthase [Salirhabdus salicampi]MCP8618009.1 phosphoribosylaminoimidazolesuccinocarboxamide synthase [Salirhabdus salicampi]